MKNKNIELKHMDIRNFKGIDRLSVEFGEQTDIYGDNATGKTSICDAFMWMMFNKDSTGATDFDIKPLNSDGEVKSHEAQTEVKAELLIDGEYITLTKIYKEKWSKQKGGTDKVFGGHTTKYEINDVPKKKGEFEAYIKDIIAEDKFRLITDVEAFNRLNWKDRREIVMEICGDVPVDMVMLTGINLEPIAELIKKHSIGEIKEIYTGRRRHAEAERKFLPERIDEALLAIKESEEVDIQTAEKSLKGLEEKLAETERKKRQLETDDAKANKIDSLKAQLRELELKNKEYQLTQSEQYASETAELRAKRSELENEIRNNIRNIEEWENKIDYAGAEIEALRAEYRAINAEQWTGDTVCPTCGQDLPEDRIEASKEAFNLNKSERKLQNKAKGQEKAAQIDTLKLQHKTMTEQLNRAEYELEKLPEVEPFAPSDMPGFKEQKIEYQTQIAALANAPQDEAKQAAVEEIENDIKAQTLVIDDIKTKILITKNNETQRARIDELKIKEKELARELEEVEQVLNACDEYVRTKVAITEKQVSEVFKKARFKMFDVQVYGGISECCEITYDGVPYDSLNNAMKINIGIDIINTLSEHYGITAPVWIDNAESVVRIEPSDGQQIRLIVSECDKELRIENNNKLNAEVA